MMSGSGNLRYLDTQRGAHSEQAHTPLVVVLGMHRSGTSALAGALVAAGAWVGDESDLMPADEHNKFGYFERRSASIALDDLLLELGGTWSTPPLDGLRPHELLPHRSVLQALIHEVITCAPTGAMPLIKDPRFSLFASELDSLLDDSTAILLSVRHPIEVAYSLCNVHRIPIPIGLALWELYNVSVCAGLAGRSVHVVCYDRLLADGDVLTEVLASALGGNEEVPPRAQEAAADSLSVGLYHQRIRTAEEEEWMSLAIAQLWQKLQESAQALRPVPMMETSLSWGSRELLLDANARRVKASGDEAQSNELSAVREQTARLTTEAASLSAELAKRQADLDAVAAERDAARHEFAGTQERIAQLTSQADRLGAELAKQRTDFDAVAAERDLSGDELSAVREQTARLTTEAASLSAELARRQADFEAVAAERDAARRELDRSRERMSAVIAEKEVAEALAHRLTSELAALSAERDQWAVSVRDRSNALRARARRAESQRDQAVADRESVADSFSALQQRANELAKDAATFSQRSRQLETELSRLQDTLDSAQADLIDAQDREDRISVNLAQEQAELTDVRNSLLVERDRALGFVESLRSVVGDFNPDVVLDSLQEEELLIWVTATNQERARLLDANATLLSELGAVNRHRVQLREDLTSIQRSESWKIGRVFTWPARLILRRSSKSPEEDANSSSDNRGVE